MSIEDKEAAKSIAKSFMENTTDTSLSASALIEALHRQLSKLEKGVPIDSYEVMMSDYKGYIVTCKNITKTIRIC